jgi:hypothetical protein
MVRRGPTGTCLVAAVGDRERVIAGVDCGFGTFAGWEWVTEDVVWAKLAKGIVLIDRDVTDSEQVNQTYLAIR